MSESPSSASPRGRSGPPVSQNASPAGTSADTPTWGEFCQWLAQRVFILSALYVLSIGPMYWHWYQSQFVGGSSILAAFYLLLFELAQWVPPFGAWLDWYLRWWLT
ncbi:MAG: hypothetical protein KF861_15715 [Planctomycetaceae bacterium]|nr:hypothetical protein [Planctomycetaceae bacterium]